MMLYVDETEIWKCPKHPSRRHLSGICSTCLKERLNTLCPDCANLRPCGGPDCAAASTSSSSTTSSFARFFSGSGGGDASAGRVSTLLEAEPSMRRSRSVAVTSLFRSRSRFVREIVGGDGAERESPPSPPATRASKRAAFLGIFRREKSRRSSEVVSGEATSCSTEEDGKRAAADVAVEGERKRMMRKSRSVAVMSNLFGGGDVRSEGRASRGWHFPSPMRAFKQSKAAAAEGSPLYRG